MKRASQMSILIKFIEYLFPGLISVLVIAQPSNLI